MASNKSFGRSTAVFLFIVFAIIDIVLAYLYSGRFLLPATMTVFLMVAKVVSFSSPVLWVIGKNNNTMYQRGVCEGLWFFGETATWMVLFIYGLYSSVFPILIFIVCLIFWIGWIWSRTIKFMDIRKPLL